jgi:hypothetical protein
LLSWVKIDADKLVAVKNSSETSRHLDESKGLADYVRLSVCKNNPMMFVALKQKRISRPVLLRISLEVVSRPGVLFCDHNAASNDAVVTTDPRVIRFDVVKKEDHFKVDKSLQKFYQGEVLVPSCVPAHLILIPSTDIFKQPLNSSLRPKASCTGLAVAREDVSTVSFTANIPTVPAAEASNSSHCDIRTTTAPEIKSDLSCVPVKRGDTVAIKADGDCCYHLAGVIGSLCEKGELASFNVPCSKAELSAARTKILDNFRRWKDSRRPFCTSEAELEALVLEATYEASDSLEARVSGLAKGKDRWGSPTDLALYTLYEDVRVVVVNADDILCGTPDDDLLKSYTVATFFDELV